MTLRRARLCDDAEKTRAGFDLHEKSHLFQRSRCRRRTGSLGIPNGLSFPLEPALPFKIPVASLSRFVTFPFGYLMKTRVIGKRSDWSRWWSELEFAREPMMRVKKPKTPSDFEWLAGCWFFSREEINTLSHAFRDGAPHFSTHARNLLREP